MEVNRLPKKTLYLWQLRFAALGLFLLAFCAYFYISYKFLIIVGAVIACISIFVIFWYLPHYIRSYKIQLSNDAVIIKRGVIIKTTHIMPCSKLIYTQTYVTPISKKLGLKAFSLKAARSQVIIPEMEKAQADSFLKALAEG